MRQVLEARCCHPSHRRLMKERTCIHSKIVLLSNKCLDIEHLPDHRVRSVPSSVPPPPQRTQVHARRRSAPPASSMARSDHQFVAATCAAIWSRDGDNDRINKVGDVSGWTYPSGRADRGWAAVVAEEKVSYHSIAPGSSVSATSTAAPPTAQSTTSRRPREESGRLRTAAASTATTAEDLVQAVYRTVGLLTDSAELDRLDAAGVKRRLALLRKLEGATTASIAAAVAALDRRGGVKSDGAASKAEWLKAHTGRTGRDAARMARLADNLEHLPATADALADGRLGAAAADAIVRASRDPRLGPPEQIEADLLDLATSRSPDQLHRHIRRRQQQADGASLLRDERRQRALRRAALNQDCDGGMWDLQARLTNETGAALRTLFDAFDHPDPVGTALIDRRRPEQRLADALEAVVHAGLDAGIAPGTGGVARPHLSVIVDAVTYAADLTNPDAPDPDAADAAITLDHPGWANLSPGTTAWNDQLSPQAVRRLCCDAAVSRIVMADSQVLDVGRATREWSEPQRRAINVRDRGCRGPACTRPIAWTQIHHVRWWRHKGRTAVDNGIALCHHCHRLVHDYRWTVAFDSETGSASWTSPSGQTTITRAHAAPRDGPGSTSGSAEGTQSSLVTLIEESPQHRR